MARKVQGASVQEEERHRGPWVRKEGHGVVEVQTAAGRMQVYLGDTWWCSRGHANPSIAEVKNLKGEIVFRQMCPAALSVALALVALIRNTKVTQKNIRSKDFKIKASVFGISVYMQRQHLHKYNNVAKMVFPLYCIAAFEI